MPVNFKFRSSAVLDAIDLGGAPFISVRDLCARIIHHKSLSFCHDFDLIVSDAVTGKEYGDDECMIPDGSSVVIRRVPCARGETEGILTSYTENFNALDNELVNFDDFGQDLCPTFGASLATSDVEAETTNQSVNDCLAAFPRNNTPPLMSKPELPMELKCSLCNILFRDAVMIPCCQHSFCDKCIRSALVVKPSCPQCGSTKCRAHDLLPNVSLRQAIEHLPEAQMAFTSSDKVFPKYEIPDDESGIQADNVKGPISVRQKQPALLDSPSATGKGSNLVMTDSACEGVAKPQLDPRIIILDSAKSVRSNQKRKQQQDVGNHLQTKSVDVAGSHGVGDPMVLPLTHPKIDASVGLKKSKGLFSKDNTDIVGKLPLPSKNKKGERNCYMCGSPDHLVRECPAAVLNSYPLHQTGNTVYHGGMSAFGQNCWSGNSFFPVRQFPYAYGASGMMPVNPAIIPVTPFAVPPYMPSYSGLPSCGFMNMGGALLSNMPGLQYLPSQVEIRENQDNGQKPRLSRDQQDRAHTSDDYHYNYDRPLDHYKSPSRRSHYHKDRYGNSTSYSGDESPKTWKGGHVVSSHSLSNRDFHPSDEEAGSGRLADHNRSHSISLQRDKTRQYSRKSGTEKQISLDSPEHGSKKRRHQRKACGSRKHGERAHRDSDSSMDGYGKYQDIVEHPSDRERNYSHHKKSKHSRRPRAESDTYASCSSQERQYNEFDGSTRHSDANGLTNKQIADDRWDMMGDLHDTYVEEYLRIKHKRRR